MTSGWSKYFASGLAVLALATVTSGCSSPDDAGPGTGGAGAGEYNVCSSETRVGEFVLTLGEGYTGVEGSVLDGVEIFRVPSEVMKAGSCRILQPPAPVPPCNPECSLAQVCTKTGCAAKPQRRDAGKVTITGLKVPFTAVNMGNVYANPPIPPLPHPGFSEGASIVLQAAGGDAGYGPFTLKGFGVAALKTAKEPLLVESGKAAKLTWTAPAGPGPARVHVVFSVNGHGRTDTWLDCVAPDTGSFEIPATLMTALFKYGVSGFPRATLTRQSADTAMVKSGCVHFRVESEISRELVVPGLISCHDDSECPKGKTCADDLSCQ